VTRFQNGLLDLLGYSRQLLINRCEHDAATLNMNPASCEAEKFQRFSQQGDFIRLRASTFTP
jgi:hypothetical protein